MSVPISRRVFHATLISSAMAVGTVLGAQAQEPGKTPPVQEPVKTTPPAQGPAREEERDYPAPDFKPSFKKPKLGNILVQDFVIYGHFNLDMVKKLLEKYPSVLNATMDWGGGDWETALGGASHLGRKDIALFLLEKGARIDIFAAAMLGHLDVVKSLLASHPTLVDAKGPHGIPLIVHAQMGLKQGVKEAEEVIKYLEGLKKT
jgi:hypothetical protein